MILILILFLLCGSSLAAPVEDVTLADRTPAVDLKQSTQPTAVEGASVQKSTSSNADVPQENKAKQVETNISKLESNTKDDVEKRIQPPGHFGGYRGYPGTHGMYANLANVGNFANYAAHEQGFGGYGSNGALPLNVAMGVPGTFFG